MARPIEAQNHLDYHGMVGRILAALVLGRFAILWRQILVVGRR